MEDITKRYLKHQSKKELIAALWTIEQEIKYDKLIIKKIKKEIKEREINEQEN